jgi:hypothetical protein
MSRGAYRCASLFLLFLLHPPKVRIKPTVGPANKFAVKSFFAAAGFVAGDQQDRAALVRFESLDDPRFLVLVVPPVAAMNC